jgi:hypothetical protein
VYFRQNVSREIRGWQFLDQGEKIDHQQSSSLTQHSKARDVLVARSSGPRRQAVVFAHIA